MKEDDSVMVCFMKIGYYIIIHPHVRSFKMFNFTMPGFKCYL